MTAWENVYIFISSTFNDMHAERDYLVKSVFPALSEWCERRKLRLIDIDLRWGVSNADVQAKNTVKTCLKNIDECRPFFLCFLGQRRGWLPGPDDISSDTDEQFPKLQKYIGKNSVTEMEILHALVDPMHNGTFIDRSRKEREGRPADHAFFFLRDRSYLDALPEEALRGIYTNDAEEDSEAADRALSHWRESLIPETGRPVFDYSARWQDGVAGAYRLGDFNCAGRPLAETIIAQLKTAIQARFPEHTEGESLTLLQKELDQQEQFLRAASEGFIERSGDFDALSAYLSNDESRPLALTARSGMGKTSLLAHFIDTLDKNTRQAAHYRFVGGSDDSVSAERLLRSLLEELRQGGKIDSEIPVNSADLFNKLPELLAEAAKSGRLVLIIDALNQLESGMSDLYWLPSRLPGNVKLIVSFARGNEETEAYYDKLLSEGGMCLCEVKPFDGESDRRALVDAYLEQYLKELDEDDKLALVTAEGAENPLFLKAVLSELRVFGYHDTLSDAIRTNFGNTPACAFDAILRRMEGDVAYTRLTPALALPHIFSWISHSRYGMSVEELADLLISEELTDDKTEAFDVIYLILRQLRPFLARRDGRIDFFYESFKLAATERYTGAHPHARSGLEWHSSLADYFSAMDFSAPRALKELPYQLCAAKRHEDYRSLLSEYRHHLHQLNTFGVNAILEDCSLSQDDSAVILRDFYFLAGAMLRDYPDQLPAQLWGRLQENGDALCDALIRDARKYMSASGQVWLRPKLPFFDRPGKGAVLREYKCDTQIAERFALSPDERLMVTPTGKSSKTSEFLVWELERGIVFRHLPVDGLAIEAHFSPDGKYLVGNYHFCGEKLRVWDTRTWTVVCDFPDTLHFHSTQRGVSSYAEDISFRITPDSRGVVAWTPSGLSVFDLTNGSLLSQTPYEYAPRAYALGGDTLAVANLHPARNNSDYKSPGAKKLRLPLVVFNYDAASGALIQKRELEGFYTSAVAVAVSKNEEYIAGGDEGGLVCLWSASSCELLGEIQGDKRGVRYLLFSPDSQRLAVTWCDGAISFCSVPDLKLRRRISCHMGTVSCAAISADGLKCLAASGAMPVIKVFSLDLPESLDKSSSESYKSLGKNEKSGLFAASSYMDYVEPDRIPTEGEASGTISFFDADSNELIAHAPLLSITNTDFPAIAPDGRFAISKNDAVENERSVMLCRWEFGDFPALKSEFPCDKAFRVKMTDSSFLVMRNNLYVHFSSDFRHVVCLPRGKSEILVFETASGRQIASMHWSGQTVRIEENLSERCDVRTGKPYDHEESLEDYVFEVTPDGKLLYSFNLHSGNLSVYKLRSGKGHLQKKTRIKGLKCGLYSMTGNAYYKNRLTRINDSLLVHAEEYDAVIDLKKLLLRFQLNKHANAEYHYALDNNTYSTLSPDEELLFVSRKLVAGEKAGDVIYNRCLEVWSVRTQRLIGRFIPNWHITNIIAENEQATFACGNGELCTLFLENFNIQKEVR